MSSLSFNNFLDAIGTARLTSVRTSQLLLAAMIVFAVALIRVSTDTLFRISSVHLALDNILSLTGPSVPHSSSSLKRLNTTLRYDWTSLERLSPLAQRFEAHQNDCSKPFVKYAHGASGLGSNIHIHSAHFCAAVEEGLYRFKSTLPWVWIDVAACAAAAGNVAVEDYGRGYTVFELHNVSRVYTRSSFDCYFPGAEPNCPQDDILPKEDDNQIPIRFHPGNNNYRCENITASVGGTSGVRAAAAEYYFTRVSPLLQREAEKQVQVVFGADSVIPPNLITIHMRWGDKGIEMKLQSADLYVKAVHKLLDQRRNRTHDVRYWNDSYTGVNIYLATEDPSALDAFRNEAPKDWNIYVDQFFPEAGAQNMVSMAMESSKAGLITLALLLLSMEANTFVLTTASNWSRLMNELRKNVLDPRCNNCTLMVDLIDDEWR